MQIKYINYSDVNSDSTLKKVVNMQLIGGMRKRWENIYLKY